MQPTRPIARATHRLARHAVSAALLMAGLAIALPGQAEPGHGPAEPGHGQPGWGGPGGWLERHAKELGIADAKLAEIRKVVDDSRTQAEKIWAEDRAAHDKMRKLLDQDQPDEAAVMKQAEVLGAIDVRRQKLRLSSMLKIRAMLTPDQRAKLRKLREQMYERPPGMHGGHHHHGDKGGPGSAGGPGGPPPAK